MTAKAANRIGSCTRCERTYRASILATWMPCPACTTDPTVLGERDAWMTEHPQGFYLLPVVKLAKIKGRVADAECDDACRSARGERCVCACGGAQHGAHYVA